MKALTMVHTHIRTAHRFISVPLLLSLGLSCASKNSEPSGEDPQHGVSSGIEADLSAEKMSVDQAIELCRAIDDYATRNTTAEVSCRTQGLAAAVLVASESSETQREECVKATLACIETVKNDNNQCLTATPPVGCRSTVKQIETCSTDAIDAGITFARGLPDCEGVAKYLMDGAATSVPSPNSCVILDQECL